MNCYHRQNKPAVPGEHQQQQPNVAAANRIKKAKLFLIMIDPEGSQLILNTFHQ
jgi:hypothetical protein